MSADKSIELSGLMTREEVGGYGVFPSLSVSTDGTQVAEAPVLTMAFLDDGDRPNAQGTLDRQRKSPPSGRTATLPAVMEAKGTGGAVYSASVVPPDVHPYLKASGWLATFSASPTPNWTYSLNQAITGLTSLGFAAFAGGERYNVRGAFGSMALAIESGVSARFTFTVTGILDTPTDDTISTTIVYPSLAIVPPKCEAIGMTIGNFAVPKILRASLDMARTVTPYRNLNVAGGVGINPGRRVPVWRVSLHKTQLVGAPFHTTSGLNPYELVMPTDGSAPPLVSIGATIGTVQYSRFRISSPQCQVLSVTPSSDGSAATWDLELMPVGSGTTIVFD
jgi:hypothetical protein